MSLRFGLLWKFVDLVGLRGLSTKPPANILLLLWERRISLYFTGFQVKAQVIDMLCFEEGSLPFKYLGVPLTSKCTTTKDFYPMIERLTSRMRSWTKKFLSYAGRLELIK